MWWRHSVSSRRARCSACHRGGPCRRRRTRPRGRIAYLQTQQEADGSIAEPAGSYADSELFAIAAAAAGYDPKALTAPSGVSVMSYLAANVAAACPVARPTGTSAGAGTAGS